jgi:hypothetical protein
MHLRPRRLSLLLLIVGVVAMANACGPAAATDDPSPSSGPGMSSEPVPSSEPGTSSEPSAEPQTSQTDTEWGRIWDDLPDGFPIFPGATPADDATPEPASAIFAIPEGDPAEIIAWMQAALETATYSTEALSGPFEDGSVVLDSVGEGDCRIQTVVAPAGGLTLMTIHYGAACPNQ